MTLNATYQGKWVQDPCPSCAAVMWRKTYDIGCGPELCCEGCDWCWGADGQDLKPWPDTRTPLERYEAGVRKELDDQAAAEMTVHVLEFPPRAGDAS